MSIQRAFAFLALLVVAPFVRAGDSYHGTVADLPDREFAVLAAQWGTGRRFADVTEKARALSTDTGLDVAVERKHFGDPFPHYLKSLVVVYLWHGEIRSATAPEHGRLRIPAPEADAARARRDWIAGRLRAAREAAGRRFDAAVASGSPDAIRDAVQENRRAARAFSRRYGTNLGDDGAGLALRIAKFEERTRSVVKGMREIEVAVASSSDWRDLEVDVASGDVLAIAAEGEWRLGKYAGSCDATGLSGDRYRNHSTVPELRHGCLLVRAGSNRFVAGSSRGAIRIEEDGVRIEAKCNDESYRDNTGAITLRVLVVPAIGTGDA